MSTLDQAADPDGTPGRQSVQDVLEQYQQYIFPQVSTCTGTL